MAGGHHAGAAAPASATETELRMAATLAHRRGQTLSHIKSGAFAGAENALAVEIGIRMLI
jgi:hypothetical protein